MTDCFICERIEAIKKGTNPYVVAELPRSYVVLGDHQFFEGYTLLLHKEHARELHELGFGPRRDFLDELARVSEAIYRAFKPMKLNYELLGNSHQHLHWHLFPRHANDPAPHNPVWCLDKAVRCAERTRPSMQKLRKLKATLLPHLHDTLHSMILQSYDRA